MLKIRLSRIGRSNQPKYRFVVAEHSAHVQGKFVEILGFYHPASNNKDIQIEKERIKYWISRGAQPSDTAASLFKRHGMSGMEAFIGRRDFKRKKKNGDQNATESPSKAVQSAAETPHKAAQAAVSTSS
ncbi:30S ribosomal protein S16 [Candidatus Peregrinibacteria bacterium]|nr:30S ribosomal protein S16 [Candidatus Peregrinibacteria bacterium]